MDLLRKRLLGLEGPYADIRVATDQLDNVKLWLQGLADSEKVDAFRNLVRLINDDNIEVATAAVLSLDYVLEHFDSTAATDVLLKNDVRLYRPPIRFGATTFGTILEEFFSRICKASIRIERNCLEELLLRIKDPVLQTSLFSFLAPNYASIVVYHAHRMLDHRNATVIAGLLNHWERIAVATALRPWPQQAVDRVKHLLQIKDANEKDIEAIISVMLDEAPLLTHPEGLIDRRRWWMIAGEPYNWTVWETGDGNLACEVLQPGLALQSTSRLLSEAEAMEFRQSRKLGCSLS